MHILNATESEIIGLICWQLFIIFGPKRVGKHQLGHLAERITAKIHGIFSFQFNHTQ